MEPKEVADSIDVIKEWLLSRKPEIKNSETIIKSTEALKSVIGTTGIVLDTFEQSLHDQTVVSLEGDSPKNQSWTDITHQLQWIDQFVVKLNEHRRELVTIELLRMNREHPITLAAYHVDEAINLVKAYSNMNAVFGLVHPDTNETMVAIGSTLIESHNSIVDIVREILMRLSIQCCIRLVVKQNHLSALLTAFLYDLMREAGASEHEIQCYTLNRRESVMSEDLPKLATPNKLSKLSVFAIVFGSIDIFSAVRCIIESYFRELYPNLIILVEEAAYDQFSKYWQTYYSQSLQIGSRLDDKVTVVDTFNDKVYIDLSAIDVRQAHKTPGNAINVLRFRTIPEALSLINQLRKIPLMSIWNDDVNLSRELAKKINQCDNFWFNYMPQFHQADRFIKDTYDLYYSIVEEDMAIIYHNIVESYSGVVEELQKTRAMFMKKKTSLRYRLVMRAYINAITKSKSLRNSSSVQDALHQLQLFYSQTVMSLIDDDSRVENYRRPMGLVVVYAPHEPANSKQKSVLFEFVIKNLLIGNAVLLNCFPNSLGAKFQLENDHIIPFVMVTDKLLHMSNLSLDESSSRRKLPKDAYAITFDLSMSSQQVDALTLALGTKVKSFWSSNISNSNYYSDD